MKKPDPPCEREWTPEDMKRFGDFPHASDCAVWVWEPCDCVTGKDCTDD